MLEIIPHLWFSSNCCNIVIMSPPMSIDIPGVAVPALLVSWDIAAAGAALSNIPPMIAKAAMTTTAAAAAVRVVFNTHDEDTTDLNGTRKSYLLFFTRGFLGLPTRTWVIHLFMICQIYKGNNWLGLAAPIQYM
jgi:hypothetical protein